MAGVSERAMVGKIETISRVMARERGRGDCGKWVEIGKRWRCASGPR